jgi:hypothetical protein
VTKQRVVAGERVSEGHATKAWPVVRHDGDRSGCFTDHVVVGVDDIPHAAVGTEVVEVEDPFGLDNGPAEATERILAARRRGDGGGEAVLGGVVDDCADPPDPATGGLELGEVHLPDPVPVGINEDGELVTVGLVERNVILGGEPGGGKSVGQSTLTATAGFSAATIDAAHRGIGFLLHEGGQPVRLRTFYLADDDLGRPAARAEALRAAHSETAKLPSPDKRHVEPGGTA